MIIKGSHTLALPRDRVWRLLQDPRVLERATPGVKTLQADGADRYRATLQLGIGPVRGTFQGRVEITEKTEPQRMTLSIDGTGAPGGVRARGVIQLEDVPGGTRVDYEGEPQLSGRLAAVGMRLLGGVAKSMATEFFTNLEREAQRAE